MNKNNNGAVGQAIVQNFAELSQLSPDAENQEIRVHCVQQMGNGQGLVIGEVVFRTFRGGLSGMQLLVTEGGKAAQSVLAQATSGLVLPLK